MCINRVILFLLGACVLACTTSECNTEKMLTLVLYIYVYTCMRMHNYTLSSGSLGPPLLSHTHTHSHSHSHSHSPSPSPSLSLSFSHARALSHKQLRGSVQTPHGAMRGMLQLRGGADSRGGGDSMCPHTGDADDAQTYESGAASAAGGRSEEGENPFSFRQLAALRRKRAVELRSSQVSSVYLCHVCTRTCSIAPQTRRRSSHAIA
jgi:hypothetical protein